MPKLVPLHYDVFITIIPLMIPAIQVETFQDVILFNLHDKDCDAENRASQSTIPISLLCSWSVSSILAFLFVDLCQAVRK